MMRVDRRRAWLGATFTSVLLMAGLDGPGDGRDRDIPWNRLRAIDHASRSYACRPHFCGNGSPPQPGLMETIEVGFHDVMSRLYTTAADFRGEPAVDLVTLSRDGKRWGEAIRKRGGL